MFSLQVAIKYPIATMYCIQWSLSAGLFKGPVLSIIRMADS